MLPARRYRIIKSHRSVCIAIKSITDVHVQPKAGFLTDVGELVDRVECTEHGRAGSRYDGERQPVLF